MKKILAMLSTLALCNIGIVSLVSCDSIANSEGLINDLPPLSRENLETFFSTHDLEYTGDFFFVNNQQIVDADGSYYDFVYSMLTSLVHKVWDDTLSNNFNFDKNAYVTRVKIQSLPNTIITFNDKITFPISFEITAIEDEFDESNFFYSNNDPYNPYDEFSFIETKQYAEKPWLENFSNSFRDFLTHGDGSEKYGDFNDQFPKTNWLENNNSIILLMLSNEFTSRCSGGPTPPFETIIDSGIPYADKMLKVVANNYEYLHQTWFVPSVRSTASDRAINVRTNLTFSYVSDPSVIVTKDVELTIGFRDTTEMGKWDQIYGA